MGAPLKILDIYSKITVTFSPEERLTAAITAMCDHHHSCVLICNGKKITGILTERDIVRLYAKYNETFSFLDPTLEEIMTPDPVCVNLETELETAIILAKTHSLRHLPVLDDKENLVGLVTMSHLMKTYLSLKEENIKLEQHNEDLRWQSLEDPLTGLLNRRAMELDLKHSAKVSQRRSESYAIALLDIDYFKKYNDHYGHDAGDKALRHVANVFRENIRGSDKAFRFGGEEFLCLMPDTDINGALIVCERIRQALFLSHIEHAMSPHHFLSMSIGIASTIGGDWEDLLKQADMALYQAKNMGRNTLCTAMTNGQSTLAVTDKRLSDSQVH